MIKTRYICSFCTKLVILTYSETIIKNIYKPLNKDTGSFFQQFADVPKVFNLQTCLQIRQKRNLHKFC